MSHTPGPWTVEDPMEGELSIVQANKPTYEWRTIASVPQGDLEDGFPQEVVEVNARLIAAAPELLDALKGMIAGKVTESQHAVHSSHRFCRACGLNSDVDVHFHSCPVYLAELAIAKAEGHS